MRRIIGGNVTGSPAHAGMVPTTLQSPGVAVWFPRPRGDGPGPQLSVIAGNGVPPPTRGWPHQWHDWRRHVRGSPAHAGMAPAGRQPSRAGRGFPRPRGDGPSPPVVANAPPAVPPPTRGWPFPIHMPQRRDRGSPAHAGMAPTAASQCVSCGRFPRPRGDGPPRRTATTASFKVPPPTRGWPPPANHE